MKTLSIAIVTPFLKHPGGVETVTSLLKRAFDESNHRVDLLTLDPSEIKKSIKKNIKNLARKWKANLQTYDLVICNGEFGYGIGHKRCINLFHGSYDGYRRALKKTLGMRSSFDLWRLSQLQVKAAKGKTVVCVSTYLKKIYERQGVRVSKVIENGVNTELFSPRRDLIKRDRFLFVGSFDYFGKGFDVLERLASDGLKIDCVTQKKPAPLLGWIPQIDHHEMPSIYPRYKIFIFPSRFEGLQVSPLEAMACGLPVVISPVGLGTTLRKEIPEFVAINNEPTEYLRKIEQIEKRYDYFSEKALDFVRANYSFDRFKKDWNTFATC